MSNESTVRFRAKFLIAALSVAALLVVAGCGGGSSSGSGSSGGGSGGGGGPTPPAPPVTFPITAFADAGGGNVTISSANTLTVGALVLITGTTNYNGTFTVVAATPSTFTITTPFAGNDATGFWQLAGGMIAGCTTSGATGAITLSNTVSRFTGVAPLAVFFDASGTTTTPATPRPFHDLGYGWNFGDSGPSAGSWSTGSRPGASSKNTATGPVAAHVYETAGTYDVTLAITDGTNTVSNACVRIAVLDPNVVFAGANTICFSQAGNFSEAPCNAAGVVQVAGPGLTFGAAIAMAAPGKRLLFRRGESWDVPTAARLMANGPGIIGAYGSAPAAPLVRATGNTTMLAISDASSPNISDWRVMDLEFDGLNGGGANAVVGAGGASQITLLRMNIHDARFGIQFSESILTILGSPHALYDQIAIADSSIQNLNDGGAPVTCSPIGGFDGGNGMFLQANQLAVLGNSVVDATQAEHLLRIQFADRAAIQANSLRLPACTKTALTLRAVTVGSTTVTTFTTQKVVITDNLLEAGQSQIPFQIAPSASSEDQRIRDIIVDGNLVRGAGGNAQTGLSVSADEVTIRNNIFDLSGAFTYSCTILRQSGAEPPHSEFRIYNNTCFTGDVTGNPLRVVQAQAGTSNITIANNLGFAPSAAFGQVVLNLGATGVTGGSGTLGNSLDAQITATSPNFAGGATPTSVGDFALNAPSYAIDSGVSMPVFTDIRRVLRPQGAAFDTGATEQ
jgi:hypothetical protein